MYVFFLLTMPINFLYLQNKVRKKISPECQSSQRPVRLVAVDVRHRRAPEVVLEHVAQRVLRQHVLVHSDGGYVVVHEVARHPVGIARHRHEPHQAVQRPLARRGHLLFTHGRQSPSLHREAEAMTSLSLNNCFLTNVLKLDENLFSFYFFLHFFHPA